MEQLEPVKFNELLPNLSSFNNHIDFWCYVKNHIKQYRLTEFEHIKNTYTSRINKEITEEEFVKEFLWCVYVSGFRAKTIQNKYNDLLTFHSIIDENGNYIQPTYENTPVRGEQLNKLFNCFKNHRKINAITIMRGDIIRYTWPKFYDKFVKDKNPIKFEQFYGIGPALSKHLARNLGNLDVIKPDVHLNRLAKSYKFNNALDLCDKINELEGYNYRLGIIDLMIWIASVDCGT